MSDERSSAKIYLAPNAKFYALWRGQPICTPAGTLRYFATESEARLFLTGTKATALDEVAA